MAGNLGNPKSSKQYLQTKYRVRQEQLAHHEEPVDMNTSVYDYKKNVGVMDLFNKDLYKLEPPAHSQENSSHEGSIEEEEKKSKMLKDLELAVKRINVFTELYQKKQPFFLERKPAKQVQPQV
jgi:hypothetical protein